MKVPSRTAKSELNVLDTLKTLPFFLSGRAYSSVSGRNKSSLEVIRCEFEIRGERIL